ncbi:MAG: TIGR03862 family flavoprotein, partial [Acidimicrobiales bacterium]
MSFAVPSPGSAAVVGGGPAGLMAAETLVSAGVQVTVYEHRSSPGRKFILAGRGGLNLTHSEPLEQFLGRYGSSGEVFESTIRSFDAGDLRAWCAELGESTFVGTSGRVFPKSFRSTPLLRAWLRRLSGSGVEFRLHHRWRGWAPGSAGGHLFFTDADEQEMETSHDVAVLALGGASWPRVGSDGGWVDRFVDRGIVVAPLRPTNCGVRVAWSKVMMERFAGVPLKNVAV